ncbi:YpjP family protein [Falsibacillus pallidus]|uniref:YpjP-like protein n=1 Tax=Falsibacillus pallidus TaxID=493781 RepID=A0A370GI88_9BACI|nr:YpjP family protein [Falsibacillus pallidus]RDI43070.1 YpjP-like protein [Falsibacillus pallidus]
MKIWLRKSFVVLISILSFGMVTPSQAFMAENQTLDKAEQQTTPQLENNYDDKAERSGLFDDTDSRDAIIGIVMKEAEKQSFEKFGQKITPVIENEFKDIILPNIQKAIEMTIDQYPKEDLSHLAISEDPSGGTSEKIFHIYNANTGNDVIRFHVRRDHPPLEGYYFNFHYHTYHDQFQTHYDLGMIYWDKNTPPKWMSA